MKLVKLDDFYLPVQNCIFKIEKLEGNEAKKLWPTIYALKVRHQTWAASSYTTIDVFPTEREAVDYLLKLVEY